jgi:hypothetical protein
VKAANKVISAATSPVAETDEVAADAARLAVIERRLLQAVQWIVYGGVMLLTVGAGALSWAHLTNIAVANGHIAPAGLVFVFPAIIDGFMVLSSAVVVRHAVADEVGGRTWYAGALAAVTAGLSVVLNIQDATGHELVPAWVLPGIAPTLYMLGTELGLTELRLVMRRLRARVEHAQPVALVPAVASKKEIVLAVLRETDWHVPAALVAVDARGLQVDRSYVYEIKREERNRSSPMQAVPAEASG